jgi:hypothetical protein
MNDEAAYAEVLDRFCDALSQGDTTDLREYLDSYDGPRKSELLAELAETEAIHQLKNGQPVDLVGYTGRFPELCAEELKQLVAKVLGYQSRLLDLALSRQDGNETGDDPNHPHLPGYGGWRRLGGGATGDVWLATNLQLKRPEAIKVANTEAWDASLRRRVRDEAQTAAALDHEGLCPVHDVRECGAGLAICLKYIPGKTLQAWADEALPKTQDLAEKLAKVAHALHHMHSKGLIHRDIKPTNIMIEDGGKGVPIVVDFGFAKCFGQSSLPSQQGSLKGTPGFMAPEQAAGRADAGPATDVYGLGAVLYALHCKRPPFEGPDIAAVLDRVQNEPLVFPAKMNQDFQAICVKAMAKKPGDRYASAKDMAEDLERYARTELLVHARPAGLGRMIVGWVRRKYRKYRPLALTSIFVSLVGITAILAVTWWRQHQSRGIAARIVALLASDHLPAKDKDRVEAELRGLAAYDPLRGREYGEKYLDQLLAKQGAEPITVDRDLERLEWLVSFLEPARGLFGPERWEQFIDMTAPYTRSGSVYFLVRPDRRRLTTRLERAVRLGVRVGPGAKVVGMKFELLRNHFALGNIERAREIAEEMLATSALSADWRMIFLRDYVWLAVQDGNGDLYSISRAQEEVEKTLAQARTGDPAYWSLLVERARLLAVQENLGIKGLSDLPERALDEYFAKVDQRAIDLHFGEPHGTDIPRDNVPGLFFLDASLLRGFLCLRKGDAAGAQKAWRRGFSDSRFQRVGAYYEGAVLGSLCEEIEIWDTLFMIRESLRGMSVAGVSHNRAPATASLQNELSGLRSVAAVRAATTILNRSWASERGREYARRIVFRKMPLSEFTQTHYCLWIFEGLRLAVSRPGAKPSSRQDDFLWSLAQQIRQAYTDGRLQEESLVDTLLVAIRAEAAAWPQAARKLPENLRGPVAYVLGCHFKLNLGRAAPGFFADALQYADMASTPALLRSLVEEQTRSKTFSITAAPSTKVEPSC